MSACVTLQIVQESDEGARKRSKGTGVFADLDDGDNDDFGSIIEDNMQRYVTHRYIYTHADAATQHTAVITKHVHVRFCILSRQIHHDD